MKINDKVYHMIIPVYIILSFFLLPVNFSKYINVFFLLIFSFSFIFKFLRNGKISFYAYNIIIILATCGISLISTIFSNFGFFDLVITTLNVLIIYAVSKKEESIKNNASSYHIFYKASTLFLTAYLLFCFLYIKNLNNMDNSFHLYGTWDKNYSAVIIFFYMCLSMRLNKKYGFILSIIYTILLNSRMLQLCSIISILMYIVNAKRSVPKKHINGINFKKPSTIILIFSSLTVVLSYYLTFMISPRLISSYQESIYDKSNAIRVRANVYAVEELTKHPRYLIYGYDGSIKKQLSVEDEKTAVIYRGYRLVQPHNFILNFILRYGLIYTLIYLILIDKILLRYNSRNNNFILYPYIIMNMIMHSLMSTGLLVFFVYILASKTEEKHE